MPVVFTKRYMREDATRNPGVLYVFGDNVLRKGYGGQAGEMRGERNAVGVATKNFPNNDDEAFFGEEPAQIAAQKDIIDRDMKPLFAHVIKGGVVIWPTDGIGTGLSQLPERAPTTADYITDKLTALCHIGELYQQGRLNSAKKMLAEHV